LSIRKLKLIASAQHRSKRLDDVLAEWLPDALGRRVSKAKARKLIMAGAVYLNGKVVRIASKNLFPGAVIETRIDLARLFDDSTSRDTRFEITPAQVLYEDADLIIVAKPPGLPAQQTVDTARDSLFAAVRRFLSARDGIDEPYVGVHHRLDRDTSGIVLFTKSRRVNAAVAELFAKHLVVKTYQALTVPAAGKLETEWTIANRLGKLPSNAKRSRYGAVASGGEPAETSFRVLAKYPEGLWIEASPKTGRTHQIRVHLSECGLPILGDDLYGAASEKAVSAAPRLMLHAAELAFPHPVTRQPVGVQSPPPRDFQECLRRIQGISLPVQPSSVRISRR
jgi:23S rRNA pseudouridine1911/1915/1917 synthase